MAGLRDRPLMRDALLAGVVIAASAAAVLVTLDRGPQPKRHFGSVPAAATHYADDSIPAAKTSSAATHVGHPSTASSARPQQIGFSPPSQKKQSDDTPLVVMVPDLPGENPAPLPPPPGAWTEQGSAGPVTGVQGQGAGSAGFSGGAVGSRGHSCGCIKRERCSSAGSPSRSSRSDFAFRFRAVGRRAGRRAVRARRC